MPMATQRRPLAGWPARPLARKPVRPLAGRPVMITGAASGIGRSLTQRLSGLGSAVAIADIDEAGLKETARTLPGPVLVRVLDVRDAADQRRFAAEVREWLTSVPGSPPLAAVFNNAGVAVASSVLDADPGDDEWLRQINFDGVVNGTRAFLPVLVEQDEGSSSTPRACSACWACPTRAPTARPSSRCAASPTRCARNCAAPGSGR
jgi:NADP-dependent 3-hydroxy acid dehydrogenase YdfG